MQLLLEEFYKKVMKVGKESPLPFRIFIRIMMFILIIVIISLIIYLYATGNYILVLVIIGLIIISESAHYIRKSREIVMLERISQKNYEMKNYRETQERSKNKTLLGLNNSKNKGLLKSSELKNRGLLRKSR